MTDFRADALLALAEELEARDALVADELALIDGLAAEIVAVRARAQTVDEAVASLPALVDEATAQLADARDGATAARGELEAAREHVDGLGRRARQDERDQAERELRRAEEASHDADVRVARCDARLVELAAEEAAFVDETAALLVEAASLASRIRAIQRVSDAGKGDAGRTLAQVEDWGARARAALFVARGALATERERIVTEANILGSSVLGEPLGGSSAALVRRRLEQHLASTNASG